ncbi:hypothetical protein GCM10018780_27310 [Streptomyces lanatus]|nr:hypothetical protein GCM10018780_27310 [Streptomyces lanatus]
MADLGGGDAARDSAAASLNAFAFFYWTSRVRTATLDDNVSRATAETAEKNRKPKEVTNPCTPAASGM